MRFKGVLFDLDGTLLNTIDDLADTMNDILSRRNLHTFTSEEYKKLVGGGTETLVYNVLPERVRTDENIKEIMAELLNEYIRNCMNKTRPYEGISELLDVLTERKIKVAVFSNKNDDLTKIMVRELLPKWNFIDVVGAKKDRPIKPDCTIALQIAEKMRLMPVEVAFLGDSDLDMQTAVSAGMYPVGAVWGYRSADELMSNGARELISHPSELLKLIID